MNNLKPVCKFESRDLTKKACVVFDQELDEYIVKFYRAGREDKPARYFTGDQQDAKQTAMWFVK